MADKKKLEKDKKIYETLIKQYKGLITEIDEDLTRSNDNTAQLNRNKKIYETLIKQYKEKITEIDEDLTDDGSASQSVQAQAQAQAQAPSSASQSVVPETEEDKKLKKIKQLLQANEAMLSECGFKIES
jgi:chromosome segregation ATPase